ncbi:MAG TPA: AraC family transcriptional regulator [Vicinamibacterales bacterium]|jgi:AraC-like DNA-binding protein
MLVGLMIRAQQLAASALITVERFDHPHDTPHVDPIEERSRHYSINFLERGEFTVRSGARRWRVTPAELFLTFPGQVLRYTHPDDRPEDVCLAVSFTEAGRDAIGAVLESLARTAPVVPMTNRRAYLRTRLADHLSHVTDSMAMDVLAAELLEGTLEERGSRRVYGAPQLAWYAERIDAARRRLDDDFASDHSLTELARDAGMSAFHFARIFRELAGTPPHRYLMRRRLDAAVIRLRDGESVTQTCYAVGFRSLSHFINVFRQRFGVSPSRARAGRAGL